MSDQHSFTLIELLIVIGILAVLVAAVVVVLNPAQLLAQARDSQRMQDLSSVSSALNTIAALDQNVSFGSSSVIYLSLPDSSSTCGSWGLTPVAGYTYHCASSATLQNIDGTGWIPVNFKTTGVVSLSALPIDPTNSSSSNLFYTYVTGGSYKLTAMFESTRYAYGGSSDKTSTDGGTENAAYEVGSNLAVLWGTPMYGKNDFTYSEDFTHWGGGAGISLNAGLAPDGSNNANLFNVASSSLIVETSPRTYQSGTRMTVSAWMRSDLPGTVIRFATGCCTTPVAQFFTLATTWKQYSITWQMTSNIQPTMYFETGSYSGSYQNYYIWGAQMTNTNSVWPYIKTTSAPLP